MKILVTGGAGFIGSNLVDQYLALGHEVAVADNFVTGLRENLNPKAKFYELDISDQKETQKVILDFAPEIINHQAAHLSVSESVKNPQYDANTNILGLLNLLEPACKNGLKKIVVASSGGVVYGETGNIPTLEDEPTKPISPYGVSKLTTENYLNYYFKQYGLDWVALRYSNVYGPRQNPKGETGVIAVFMNLLGQNLQPQIFGNGLQTRDYVYIDDVVSANMLATNNGFGAYNIATSRETNVIEVFDLVQDLMGTNFPKKFGPRREGEQLRSCLSVDRAKNDLGWKPKINLSEGIRRTVAWYRAKNLK